MRAVYKNFGKRIDMKNFESSDLTEAINSIMNDTNPYRQSIEHASRITKSQPISGRELAGYWTDHVLKFGAKHMRSRAFDIPLSQYLMIDVMAGLVFGTCFAFGILYFILRQLYKYINRRNAFHKSKDD